MSEFKLRDYQEKAIEETVAEVTFGEKNVVVDSPPASGKSIMISETAKRLVEQNDGTVFISVTISALLDQIAEHLDIVGADYSILKAKRDSEFDSSKKIQLCQAQTLHARIDKINIKCDYFIMDEVHREYQTKRTMDILNKLEPRSRIGYSGTPYDQSGFALKESYTVHTTSINKLEEMGYLSKIKYLVPKWSESIDYSRVKKTLVDYNNAELDEIINSDKHIDKVIESLNEIDAKSKKSLIFCSGIDQCEKVTKRLIDAGYNAASFHSKTEDSDNLIHCFKNNKKYNKRNNELDQTPSLFDKKEDDPGEHVTHLVSVNKLGIGFDCPDVELMVQLRPTKVKSLFIQQVMRGARGYNNIPKIIPKIEENKKVLLKYRIPLSKYQQKEILKECQQYNPNIELIESKKINKKNNSRVTNEDDSSHSVEKNGVYLVFDQSVNESEFDEVHSLFHKQYAEYLDLGKTLSSHGFHNQPYHPPTKTGINEKDYKLLEEANEDSRIEDLTAILDSDKIEEITREKYNLKIKEIKESLAKDLYSLPVKDLVAAFEVSKDHKEIITIATIIYTLKFGDPISKAGRPYKYRPENFWGTSTFGNNTDFHVTKTMDEYFEIYPTEKRKWINALKTRCKNIIKEGKPLFGITGFIKFLAEKYESEKYSIVEEYRKKPEPTIPQEIDIDEDEIPF